MCRVFIINVNESACEDKFFHICGSHGFHIDRPINKKVYRFESDIKGGAYFFLMGGFCNCAEPVGRQKPDHPGLPNYLAWLTELKACKNLKALHFISYWHGHGRSERLKSTITTNIEEIDLKYLASMQDDVAYRIEYFKRYT